MISKKLLMRFVAVAFVVTLAGCAGPMLTKVDSGESTVGGKFIVKVDTAWNKFERGVEEGSPTWTIEGVFVDAMVFYPGITDGQVIAKDVKGQQPLTFKASMQPADIVALYQGLWTRDGSSFQLDKLEPAEFMGGKGFRFEYSLNRKADDLPMRGIGYGIVRDRQLYLIHYRAPRLVFFPRYQQRAEGVMHSARLVGTPAGT